MQQWASVLGINFTAISIVYVIIQIITDKPEMCIFKDVSHLTAVNTF